MKSSLIVFKIIKISYLYVNEIFRLLINNNYNIKMSFYFFTFLTLLIEIFNCEKLILNDYQVIVFNLS